MAVIGVGAGALAVRIAGHAVVVPPVDRALWVAALVVFGVGDAATTVLAVRRYGLAEANPLVVRLAGRHPSVAATLAFKAATLAVGAACYAVLQVTLGRVPALAVPLFLLSLGALATQHNLLNIVLVAGAGD